MVPFALLDLQAPALCRALWAPSIGSKARQDLEKKSVPCRGCMGDQRLCKRRRSCITT